MQNKCQTLIKAGFVAVIASMPISLPAQASNMLYDYGSTTDSNVPSVSQKDGNTATTLLDEVIGTTDSNSTFRGSLDLGPNHANSSTFSNLVPPVNSGARVFVIGADSRSAPSDADMAAFLGGPGSALDNFFSPGTVINATHSINTELVDIRDVALLGGTTGGIDFDPIQMLGPVSFGSVPYDNFGSSKAVENLETTPNLSQESQDRPLIIRWINSLLEVVGINKQCSDPNGCDRRIAVKQKKQ